jgi:hypothetical protein
MFSGGRGRETVHTAGTVLGDELIEALTRLRVQLELQPPRDPLQRLVHQRRTLQLSREVLTLQSRYIQSSDKDPAQVSSIDDLTRRVDELSVRRR